MVTLPPPSAFAGDAPRRTNADHLQAAATPLWPEGARDRCWLTVLIGPAPGLTFDLVGPEVTIGRQADCGAQIPDPSLSRTHARIFRRGGDLWLEDLDSANGTSIRGASVTEPTVLTDGTCIELGTGVVLKFSRQDPNAHDAARRAYEAAVRDPLTGVYTRSYFEDYLASEIAFSLRHGSSLSAVLVDLDRFRHLNAARGPHVGDAVLRVVAASLARIIRREDMLARLAGDRFALLTRGLSATNAGILGERLRRQVESLELPWQDEILRVTLSAGIATARPGCRFGGSTELFAAADAALYKAKVAGGNRVVSV